MLPLLAVLLAADSLIGVWGGDTTYAPHVRGTLQIEHVGDQWTARVGGLRGDVMATPARLRAIGPQRWSGAIEPIDDHYALYLVIRRAAGDSGLRAIFRVPERNYVPNVSWAHYQVMSDGDSVRFVDPANSDVHIAGVLDGSRLRLRWPAADVPITLRRGWVAGFYPRPSGSAPYRYRTRRGAMMGGMWRRRAMSGSTPSGCTIFDRPGRRLPR
jgi:hypothetical protein